MRPLQPASWSRDADPKSFCLRQTLGRSAAVLSVFFFLIAVEMRVLPLADLRGAWVFILEIGVAGLGAARTLIARATGFDGLGFCFIVGCGYENLSFGIVWEVLYL